MLYPRNAAPEGGPQATAARPQVSPALRAKTGGLTAVLTIFAWALLWLGLLGLWSLDGNKTTNYVLAVLTYLNVFSVGFIWIIARAAVIRYHGEIPTRGRSHG